MLLVNETNLAYVNRLSGSYVEQETYGCKQPTDQADEEIGAGGVRA